jgi:hypothetical protein
MTLNMRTILISAVALAIGTLVWGAEPGSVTANKGARSKKPAATSSARKAPDKTTSTRKPTTTRRPTPTTASARSASKKAPPPPRSTWRNRQATPSPSRYNEIQNALVAKGYLAPNAAGGTWDQTSVEALKRFQAEQNLDTTGKINSLSLIALGLGPKHDAPANALEVNPGQFDR